MSFDYAGFLSSLANGLVIDPTDANYIAFLPRIIDDVEGRIYRELDLLSTVVRDTSGSLTANSRNFTLPQALGRFVVTEGVNVFTPVGTTTNRFQLLPVSKEYLDAIWPDEAAPSLVAVPTVYAMITDQTIIVGPAPAAAYRVEVIGTIRPTPLSVDNPETFLSLYLPDLFFAEAMVIGYGYLKDFGAMADDPKASVSWESHYQTLWQSANTEENRKKYASAGWTSKQPAPLATPPRA